MPRGRSNLKRLAERQILLVQICVITRLAERQIRLQRACREADLTSRGLPRGTSERKKLAERQNRERGQRGLPRGGSGSKRLVNDERQIRTQEAYREADPGARGLTRGRSGRKGLAERQIWAQEGCRDKIQRNCISQPSTICSDKPFVAPTSLCAARINKIKDAQGPCREADLSAGSLPRDRSECRGPAERQI